MTHEIKIQKQFADDILSGKKTFEIREDDRGYQTGDIVKFRVVRDGTGIPDADTKKHPLNGEEYKITYILSGWGLKNGMVAFSIKPMKKVPKCLYCGDFLRGVDRTAPVEIAAGT